MKSVQDIFYYFAFVYWVSVWKKEGDKLNMEYFCQRFIPWTAGIELYSKLSHLSYMDGSGIEYLRIHGKYAALT